MLLYIPFDHIQSLCKISIYYSTQCRLLSHCLLAIKAGLYTWTKYLMWIILPFLIKYLRPVPSNVCHSTKLCLMLCSSPMFLNLFMWRWRFEVESRDTIPDSPLLRTLNYNTRMLPVSAETYRLQRISEVQRCVCVCVSVRVSVFDKVDICISRSCVHVCLEPRKQTTASALVFPPRSCHFLSNKLSDRLIGPAGAARLHARPSAGRRRRTFAQLLMQLPV